MEWKPVHPKHAIERVRLVARLTNALPAKFVRMLAAEGEKSRVDLGFTSKNLREGQQISLNGGAISISPNPTDFVGWDWQRVSAGNVPIESLVVESQTVAYETAQYTRWAPFVERFEQVAIPSLVEVLEVVDLASLSLEYIDLFIFDGDPEAARPADLIPWIADMLPEDAVSGRELWHLHRGWFERTNGVKLLINQNFDARNADAGKGEVQRNVHMLTKTELRPEQDGFEFEKIRAHLDDIHARSIQLFRSAVNSDLHDAVGLKERNSDET